MWYFIVFDICIDIDSCRRYSDRESGACSLEI